MRKPSATFVLDERLARRKKTFLTSMATQDAAFADDPVAVVARNRAVRVLARCGLDSGPYSRVYPLPAEESGMRIGEVARAAGVGIDAVRFYEREGLIQAPARRPSGYREYTPDVVVSLRFIGAPRSSASRSKRSPSCSAWKRPRAQLLPTCGHVPRRS